MEDSCKKLLNDSARDKLIDKNDNVISIADIKIADMQLSEKSYTNPLAGDSEEEEDASKVMRDKAT